MLKVSLYPVAMLTACGISIAASAKAGIPVAPLGTAQVKSAWEELTEEVLSNDPELSSDRLLMALGEQFRKDPDMLELDTEYPGLLDALIEGIRPIMRREAGRVLPLYAKELAGLYASNLSEAEAQEVKIFFRSPAMKHFAASLLQNQSFNNTLRDMIQGSDISEASLQHDNQSAAIQASLQMDGNELAEVKKFFAEPLGQKLAGLNARKREIDAKWTNYISPVGEKEIEPAVLDIMIAHIGKTDPEVARGMAKQLKRPYKPLRR